MTDTIHHRYFHVPAEHTKPCLDAWRKERDEKRAEFAWILAMGAAPMGWSGWDKTYISGVKFDDGATIPAGWRASDGFHKPDKRNKAGRENAARLERLTTRTAAHYLEAAGIPLTVMLPGKWHSPGVTELRDGSVVVSIKAPEAAFTPPAHFRALKASEYYALIEANTEEA